MKTLNTNFAKQGFEYQQVLREGMLAIYTQKSKISGLIVAHEVIKIKQAPAHQRSGVDFPAMELYPSAEQFGLNGWSYGTFGDLSASYKRALEKFNQLKQQQDE